MKPAVEAWPPMLRNALTAIAVTLAVSGCAVGPDYVTPPVAVPSKWSLADRSQSATAPVLAHWWMAQERIRLGKLSASVDSYRQAALALASALPERICQLFHRARCRTFALLRRGRVGAKQDCIGNPLCRPEQGTRGRVGRLCRCVEARAYRCEHGSPPHVCPPHAACSLGMTEGVRRVRAAES